MTKKRLSFRRGPQRTRRPWYPGWVTFLCATGAGIVALWDGLLYAPELPWRNQSVGEQIVLYACLFAPLLMAAGAVLCRRLSIAAATLFGISSLPFLILAVFALLHAHSYFLLAAFWVALPHAAISLIPITCSILCATLKHSSAPNELRNP